MRKLLNPIRGLSDLAAIWSVIPALGCVCWRIPLKNSTYSCNPLALFLTVFISILFPCNEDHYINSEVRRLARRWTTILREILPAIESIHE